MENTFEKYPLLSEHIERMAKTGHTGSNGEWSSFLRQMNNTLIALQNEVAISNGESDNFIDWLNSQDRYKNCYQDYLSVKGST